MGKKLLKKGTDGLKKQAAKVTKAAKAAKIGGEPRPEHQDRKSVV